VSPLPDDSCYCFSFSLQCILLLSPGRAWVNSERCARLDNEGNQKTMNLEFFFNALATVCGIAEILVVVLTQTRRGEVRYEIAERGSFSWWLLPHRSISMSGCATSSRSTRRGSGDATWPYNGHTTDVADPMLEVSRVAFASSVCGIQLATCTQRVREFKLYEGMRGTSLIEESRGSTLRARFTPPSGANHAALLLPA
jgi:hypothetical protein